MPDTIDNIHLLLVEDDAQLARVLSRYLEARGLRVTCVGDGHEGLRGALSEKYDVVVLDLMLPDRDGLQVCRSIRRESDVPIVMISARAEESDLVLGLESGADDYVPKPVAPSELFARIRAAVRRARGQVGPHRKSALVVGELTLDAAAMEATIAGRALALTAYEFSLLRVLCERANKIVSREQLMDQAKGSADESFERSVDVHVSRLRRKLGEDPKQPRMLKTVRGVGYVLVAPGDADDN